MPAYCLSKYDFFRADACPEEISIKRESAFFNAMQQQWEPFPLREVAQVRRLKAGDDP